MSKIYNFSKTSIFKILFKILDILTLFFKNNKIIKLKIVLGIMLLTASSHLKAQDVPNNKRNSKKFFTKLIREDYVRCYVGVPLNKITLSSNSNYFLANQELYFSFGLAYEYLFGRKLWIGFDSEITFYNLNFNGVLIGSSFRFPILWRFYGNLLYQYGLYNSTTNDFFTDYHSTGIEISWRKRFNYKFGLTTKAYFTSSISANTEFEIGAGIGVYYRFF